MTLTKDGPHLDLLQGTLDLLILQTVRRGPQHGYGISKAIRAGSNELLQVETGSLYPALHRLEKKGWVSSDWGTTENNQRAKFYELTAHGKRQLVIERSRWIEMVEAVGTLIKPQGTEA